MIPGGTYASLSKLQRKNPMLFHTVAGNEFQVLFPGLVIVDCEALAPGPDQISRVQHRNKIDMVISLLICGDITKF